MKKKVHKVSNWLFYLALLPVTLGICAWQGWAWWSWASAPPVKATESTSSKENTIQIKIPRGTGSQKIGRDLEALGLIRSSTAWRMWAFWLKSQNAKGDFKSGTYKLSPTQSMPEIAQKIWGGDVMKLSYTIPEGWSLREMAAYFESLGFFKAQDFLTAASQIPTSKYPWLPAGIPHLEGFLFPDTYQLASDRVTPQQVIEQMLNHFQETALPLYQQDQKRTKLSLLQWVNLASIVEQESVVASERTRIAGVFTRRLKLGMRLESDPTVEYGLGFKQTPDKPLTFAQVKTASPYNTYVNAGLPPTPICSPGLASLKATLYPENTEYLFFVARYDGTHVFSRTFAAHQAATNAIRQQQSKRAK